MFNPFRGLFGSSARAAAVQPPLAMQDGASFAAKPGLNPSLSPYLEENASAGMPAAGEVLRQAPTVDPVQPNPVHSYLGGLVKYQRPEGQTDAERMAIIGATLSDVGSAFGGGSGGNLASVQENFRKRSQLDRARGLAKGMFPDDPAAELMFDINPQAIADAWVAKQKPTKPVVGVDGGYGYKIDPVSGDVTWGPQRPPSHAELQRDERDEALTAYREALIRLGDRRVDVQDRNAGTAEYKARHPASGRRGGGAASGGGGGGGMSGVSTAALLNALKGGN